MELEKFEELLLQLEEDPNNLDLLNSAAIGYMENHDKKEANEDFDCFEKAYLLKKTIKSTNNFAWFLYFEWADYQRTWNGMDAAESAITIQKECINLNPSSFYPYYLYAFMLLEQKKFREALEFLAIAKSKGYKRGIDHNIGYCYYHLSDFEKARDHFFISSNDSNVENHSTFCLAITEFQLNNVEKVKQITDTLFDTNNFEFTDGINGYEIGTLYYLLNDYEKATECVIKQRIDGIDFLDWEELSYSIYEVNEPLWRIQLNVRIEEDTEVIAEILSNHEDWNDESIEEKQAKISDINFAIEKRKSLLREGISKPDLNLIDNISQEHCGCLLFDCDRHDKGNIESA